MLVPALDLLSEAQKDEPSYHTGSAAVRWHTVILYSLLVSSYESLFPLFYHLHHAYYFQIYKTFDFSHILCM